MKNFYQEDLAYIHHAGFGDFAEQAGDEILVMYSRAGVDSGLVVDLGCGSGIWAAKLLNAGFDVLGADVSASMLKLARQYASQGEFVHSSLFDIELPPCASVTALGEELCYGAEDIPTNSKLSQLFCNVAEQLPPGGQFLFDVIVESPLDAMNYQSCRKGEDWAVLVSTEEQPGQGKLNREITVFRQMNGEYRRTEESHLVRVYNVDELSELLIQAGFTVTVTNQYGNYQLAPRRSAFIAIRE